MRCGILHVRYDVSTAQMRTTNPSGRTLLFNVQILILYAPLSSVYISLYIHAICCCGDGSSCWLFNISSPIGSRFLFFFWNTYLKCSSAAVYYSTCCSLPIVSPIALPIFCWKIPDGIYLPTIYIYIYLYIYISIYICFMLCTSPNCDRAGHVMVGYRCGKLCCSCTAHVRSRVERWGKVAQSHVHYSFPNWIQFKLLWVMLQGKVYGEMCDELSDFSLQVAVHSPIYDLKAFQAETLISPLFFTTSLLLLSEYKSAMDVVVYQVPWYVVRNPKAAQSNAVNIRRTLLSYPNPCLLPNTLIRV